MLNNFRVQLSQYITPHTHTYRNVPVYAAGAGGWVGL
jgi:hypothetical protein